MDPSAQKCALFESFKARARVAGAGVGSDMPLRRQLTTGHWRGLWHVEAVCAAAHAR